jgi:hypothetical protein
VSRPRLLFAVVSLVAVSSIAWAVSRDERAFPHLAHQGIFPTCDGCHAGVVTGERERKFPDPASCSGCHDGVEQPRVTWSGPTHAPDNLRFSHRTHAEEAGFGMATTDCAECHQQPGEQAFMAVMRALPENCIDCHAHRATAHLAQDSPCAQCHVPLVQVAALSADRVAGLPLPPSHQAPDFILDHAPGRDAAESCAVCHTRESCERCHINAARLPAIASLGTDTRVARLVAGRRPEYPLPPSHLTPEFASSHGDLARSEIQSCANCHAQPSCRSCHIGRGADREISRLPVPPPGGPRGVELFRRERWGQVSLAEPAESAARLASTRPAGAQPIAAAMSDTSLRRRFVRVHAPGYERTHEVDASTQRLDCSSCHTKKYCSDCHQGEGKRRYHPPNFVQRHAPESYGRQQNCSSCHNPTLFCKSCHQQSGLGSAGALNTAFHNAQPNWLIQHARAARQELQSCATCHQQNDCTRCHSQRGWGISPHGPDFNARAMASRSASTCRVCHLGDPLAPR